MSQSWRSRTWQDLAPYAVHSMTNAHRDGGLEEYREEGHELLSAFDEDGSLAGDVEQPHQQKVQTTAWQSKTPISRRGGCARRYAYAIASAFLLLLLVVGLLVTAVNILRRTDKDKLKVDISADSITAKNDTALDVPAVGQTVRREWRALSSAEKQSYISALKCLQTLPAALPHMPTNASAYSDFPYIHAHVGYRTHNSASFLPWHRYFLHLYEQRLRSECRYEGGIPYWDWTLDAGNLAAAPVFDSVNGFGGDGSRDGEIVAGSHGRCVLDGPFSGLQVLWYDVKYQPHCLSRGFRTDEGGSVGLMDGQALSPTEIDSILDLNTYQAFVTALEKKVHDVIPFGVGGDFETLSAPFEPLFWLHHSQLDRLWWLWQTQKEGRQAEYGGHRFRHSIGMAGLSDMIEMRGTIGSDVKVSDVMNISGSCGTIGDGVLCYSYA